MPLQSNLQPNCSKIRDMSIVRMEINKNKQNRNETTGALTFTRPVPPGTSILPITNNLYFITTKASFKYKTHNQCEKVGRESLKQKNGIHRMRGKDNIKQQK